MVFLYGVEFCDCLRDVFVECGVGCVVYLFWGGVG